MHLSSQTCEPLRSFELGDISDQDSMSLIEKPIYFSEPCILVESSLEFNCIDDSWEKSFS